MTGKPGDRGGRMPPQQEEPEYEPQPQQRRRGGYQRQSIAETVAKSFIRSIASSLGRILVRTLTGGRR